LPFEGRGWVGVINVIDVYECSLSLDQDLLHHPLLAGVADARPWQRFDEVP